MATNTSATDHPPKRDRMKENRVNFWKEEKVLSKRFRRRLQCDQIGRFLKVLGNKVPCKSSPNIEQHFRLLWKMALVMLHWCGYFLGTFWWKLGYFLLQHLVTHTCLFTLAFWLNTSQRIFTVKGSITVQMTSYLTVLYSTKEGIKHLLDISSKAVEFKQEESRTEILPPYEVTE